MAVPEKNTTGETVTRYDARGAWDYGSPAELFEHDVPKVMIRGDSIVIGWAEVEGEKTHTVLMRDGRSRYRGKSVWGAGKVGKEQHAEVEAVLYSNETGHILVGQEGWSKPDWFVIQLSNGRSYSVTKLDNETP